MKKFTEKLNESSDTLGYLESRDDLAGESRYNFWLVTGATPDSELIDVVTLVDSKRLFSIARGSSKERDNEVEIFPYDKGEEALELAKKRIDEAK